MARRRGFTASIRRWRTPAVRPANGRLTTSFSTCRILAPNGELLSPGYVTVFHNGVVAQNHQAIRGATNWRVPGKYTPHGPTGPLALQYHNNSVAFRNIWVRPVPVVNEP